jgi:hypothetical protein
MNKTRTWTLAAIVGLLGAGDWFLAPLPADENAPPKPVLTVGNAVVTAAVRDVDAGGKKEPHLFLDLKGEGAGTIKVRFSSTTIIPESRMMPRPKILWEKEVALDSTRSGSVDLGAFAGEPKAPVLVPGYLPRQVIHTLAASADGKTYVSLWTTRLQEQKKSLPSINRTEM